MRYCSYYLRRYYSKCSTATNLQKYIGEIYKKGISSNKHLIGEIDSKYIVKMMKVNKYLHYRDTSVDEWMIQQLKSKLLTGDAYTSLVASDYITILDYMCMYELTSTKVEVATLIGNYIHTSYSLYTHDIRTTILSYLSRLNYTVTTTSNRRMTKNDVQRLVSDSLGVSNNSNIDISYNIQHNYYRIHIKSIDIVYIVYGYDVYDTSRLLDIKKYIVSKSSTCAGVMTYMLPYTTDTSDTSTLDDMYSRLDRLSLNEDTSDILGSIGSNKLKMTGTTDIFDTKYLLNKYLHSLSDVKVEDAQLLVYKNSMIDISKSIAYYYMNRVSNSRVYSICIDKYILLHTIASKCSNIHDILLIYRYTWLIDTIDYILDTTSTCTGICTSSYLHTYTSKYECELISNKLLHICMMNKHRHVTSNNIYHVCIPNHILKLLVKSICTLDYSKHDVDYSTCTDIHTIGIVSSILSIYDIDTSIYLDSKICIDSKVVKDKVSTYFSIDKLLLDTTGKKLSDICSNKRCNVYDTLRSK